MQIGINAGLHRPLAGHRPEARRLLDHQELVGYLANVFLTECSTASTKASSWELSGSTIRSAVPKSSAQCLDVGSAGSGGDLGFEFQLLPAATLETQAFHSEKWVSWGRSVIQDPDTKKFITFAAVFEAGKGLDAWTWNSEIMHLIADTPSGPFKPTTNGNKSDGVIVGAEVHNPTIIRASNGTYLLFSIRHSPFLASASLDRPWASCNNLSPLVIAGRPRLLLNKQGVPTHLYNGVCLGDDGYNQNSTGPNHCFTFVQEIDNSLTH